MHLTLSLDQFLKAPPGRDEIGPGSAGAFVVVDARGADIARAATHAAWLKQAPCPVIALTDPNAPELAFKAFDAHVADPALVQRIASIVAKAPLAAMTFVQTLRTIEGLAPDSALMVESFAYGLLHGGAEFRNWRAGDRARVAGEAEAGPAVLLERDRGVLSIVLNRPGNRNAVSVEMRDALVQAFDLASADDSIETVNLRAIGKCFSTGGDLSEFGLCADAVTGHWIRALRSPAFAILGCAAKLNVRVNGACIGAGVELSAFARRIQATNNAFFQLPELTMGLIPGSGGCVSISRRIGRQRTALMGLTAKRVSARTARAWGLIDALED